MRKIFGVGSIVLGILCLMGAVGLVVYNHLEADAAEEASAGMVREVRTIIEEQTQQTPAPEIETVPQADGEEEPLREMPAVQLDGYDCVGILSIPVLELELPVLKDWDYRKLKKAPCQYYGSCCEENFVIAGHNYAAHFGRLSDLLPGDLILYTDMAGEIHCYTVVLLETLPATATESMLTSGFDLSLYTCTPGGANRVTVRCEKESP